MSAATNSPDPTGCGVRAAARHGVRWLCALAALWWSCEFRPDAHRAPPRRISAEPMRLVRSLDPLGGHLLVTYAAAGGERKTAIYAWRSDERCDLPNGIDRIGRALIRPTRAPRGSPALWLPLAIQTAEGTQLWLVDEHCKASQPQGGVAPDTLRTLVSREDQRGMLLFEDAQGQLSLLDPWRYSGSITLAGAVSDVQVAPEAPPSEPDSLWLLEEGVLTRRSSSGEALLTLGEQVSAFALARDGSRVAYVDGTTLLEAVAPAFTPKHLADDACAPRYDEQLLDFWSPCAQRALKRRSASGGSVQSFPEGVFASVQGEGMRLDYAQRDAGDALSLDLFAESKRFGRRRVQPAIAPQDVYVLDDQRIAGVALGSFATWSGVDDQRHTLLDAVDTVVPHFRGKTHRYAWLVRHDVAGQLGSLSVVQETDLQPKLLAMGVPARASGGFAVDRGAALPNYPYSEPLLILLEAAQPLAADPERRKGRLRAMLMSGELSGDLAEDVTSYVLVAAPLPGIVYGVEEGAAPGVWFVAL